MAYITKDELKAFADKYPDDDSLLEGYCTSAEQIIENYLGYSPALQEYTTSEYGLGSKNFALEAKPIVSVSEILEGETPLDLSTIKIIKNSPYIAFAEDGCFLRSLKYTVTYMAGYAEVPQHIKTVALQIASLLWESAGGNLAVTSTSYGDMGGRTFQSFKPDRFLDQIASYRLAKVDY